MHQAEDHAHHVADVGFHGVRGAGRPLEQVVAELEVRRLSVVGGLDCP